MFIWIIISEIMIFNMIISLSFIYYMIIFKSSTYN